MGPREGEAEDVDADRQWTIFEDAEDEIRHERRRADALARALKAARVELARLHEAGALLQDAYEASHEALLQAEGDVAYWKEVARGQAEELTLLRSATTTEAKQAAAKVAAAPADSAAQVGEDVATAAEFASLVAEQVGELHAAEVVAQETLAKAAEFADAKSLVGKFSEADDKASEKEAQAIVAERLGVQEDVDATLADPAVEVASTDAVAAPTAAIATCQSAEGVAGIIATEGSVRAVEEAPPVVEDFATLRAALRAAADEAKREEDFRLSRLAGERQVRALASPVPSDHVDHARSPSPEGRSPLGGGRAAQGRAESMASAFNDSDFDFLVTRRLTTQTPPRQQRAALDSSGAASPLSSRSAAAVRAEALHCALGAASGSGEVPFARGTRIGVAWPTTQRCAAGAAAKAPAGAAARMWGCAGGRSPARRCAALGAPTRRLQPSGPLGGALPHDASALAPLHSAAAVAAYAPLSVAAVLAAASPSRATSVRDRQGPRACRLEPSQWKAADAAAAALPLARRLDDHLRPVA